MSDPAGSEPPPFRVLHAPGLTLEPQTVAHADAMFALLSDPALYALEGAPPASRDALAARFARLETRRSGDGRELWFNWVLRLPDGALAGYVQATVRADGSALVAYVLGGAYQGRGLATRAVAAMLDELAAHWEVRRAYAILKAANAGSLRLLDRLGFTAARPGVDGAPAIDADELLLTRPCTRSPP